jgi:phage terminase large subunit-like protein
LEAKAKRRRRRRIDRFYPETGELRRELYTKHLEFFKAGKHYRERLMLAGNRIGKSEGVGGYELTLHLTGEYPAWWPGRRFNQAIRAWAAGDTSVTVRDILQYKLLGPINDIGTGLIPGDAIVDYKRKSGVPDGIELVWVKHKKGGVSYLSFKSYDQRRESFQGTEQDVIWLDEEPDMGVYSECLMRTMTTDGLLLLTFTPLQGISEVVKAFLEDGKVPNASS